MTSFFLTLDGSPALFRLSTTCLILFLAISSQYYILIPWLSTDFSFRHHIIVFNTGIALVLWTFYLVCTVDPGQVKRDYLPEEDVHVRYCKLCKAFKPPRTHHCRKCSRCVLRMDHHCPWLSCCIGYYNHALFIKFMLAVVPTTAYLTYMMARKLYLDVTSDDLDTFLVLMTALNCLGGFFVAFMVSFLLCYQLWCVVENITTIESWSKKRTDDLIYKNRIPAIEFPYDLYSIRENMRQVMGPSVILWFWPPTRAAGDGHAFPVNEDADMTRPWPPKEPPRRTIQIKPKDDALRHRQLPTNEEDFSYEDYARMGLIEDSEDDSEYVDDEGEDLEGYGVEEGHQADGLREVLDNGMTVGQLLEVKRQEVFR